MIYDAVIVAGGTPPPAGRMLAARFLLEAFGHGKPIAAVGAGTKLLAAAGIAHTSLADGVVVGDAASDVVAALIEAMREPGFPLRALDLAPGAWAAELVPAGSLRHGLPPPPRGGAGDRDVATRYGG